MDMGGGDVILGTSIAGNATIDGASGNDEIYARTSGWYYGSAGNDFFWNDSPHTSFMGGDDNDLFCVGNASDRVRGGAGYDVQCGFSSQISEIEELSCNNRCGWIVY